MGNPAGTNTLLITNNYPSYDDLYNNAFVHTRVREYKKRGYGVDVFRFNGLYPRGFSEFEGISVATGEQEQLVEALRNGRYKTVLVHFLSQSLWSTIKPEIKGKRLIVWAHGFEIQSWTRRMHNFTTKEQQDAAKDGSEKRTLLWQDVFNFALAGNNDDIHLVFVSEYLKDCAFEDIGVRLPEGMYSIIHNYINNDQFSYREKTAEQRCKILSIRPFANNNYANDLTVQAILELSRQPFFEQLSFRIIGNGELYETTVAPLTGLSNVHLEQRFLLQDEIADLHKEYGVFLVPTRMDTQGVSRDEAMSSGLVPITNSIAAIPEFVDENCGILAPAEDFKALANGIIRLFEQPGLYLSMSHHAAQRVKEQSGAEATIGKEIQLIFIN